MLRLRTYTSEKANKLYLDINTVKIMEILCFSANDQAIERGKHSLIDWPPRRNPQAGTARFLVFIEKLQLGIITCTASMMLLQTLHNDSTYLFERRSLK